MDNTIRWGVIGCGQIAVDKALPAIHAADGTCLVAVSDPLPERRRLAGETRPVELRDMPLREYDNYAGLLGDAEVDAVYISLPTGMHTEAVLAAMQAGKPTLCEKPLGRNLDEVLAMVRAAKETGTPLMTAYMSRFGSIYQEAARLIREGAVGTVTYVHADFSYPALESYPLGTPGSWRWTDAEGGGPVLDIGIYLAFALREWLDDRIETVCASALDRLAPAGLPVRDTTMAWFRTEGGIPGTFAATFTHSECRISVYGTKGRLDVDGCFAQGPGGRLTCRAGTVRYSIDNDMGDKARHFEHYLREIEHFSSALQTRADYHPSPDEVLADTQFLQALRDSATLGRPIVLPSIETLLENHSK